MGKYKVLHPIALSGRRERGDIVEISDSQAPSYVGPGLVEEYTGEAEPVNEPAEVPLEEMDAAQLKERAKELGLPVSGSKADLLERITLHLEGDEEGDEEGGDAEGEEDGAPAPTADDAPAEGDEEETTSDDDEETSEDAGDSEEGDGEEGEK